MRATPTPRSKKVYNILTDYFRYLTQQDILTHLQDRIRYVESSDLYFFYRTDSDELLTALNTLFDGAAQLKDGSITLLDGVKTLKDGLDTLSSNSSALNDGAAQLFAAVLDTANTQLSAAGLDALSIEVPALTASNYAAVLDDLIAQLDPAVIDKTIEDLAKAHVREAVMAQEDKVCEAVTEVVRGQVRDAVQAQEETIRAAVTDVVKEQVRQAVAAQEDTIRAAVTQAVQAQVQDAVQAQEDTIRAGVTQAAQAQVLEGVLAQAGLNMTAQQYQDAVAAGKVTAAQQKQISAAVDQMMTSDDIKAKIEAAVTEQENQLVAQNMATDDIKAKIESAVTEQENQLIAQNMASGDIKAKIESAVAEQENQLVEENFASADVQAKLEAAVTEQIDKLVEENYASADVQNTMAEKKATIAAAVDSLKNLKEQLASFNPADSSVCTAQFPEKLSLGSIQNAYASFLKSLTDYRNFLSLNLYEQKVEATRRELQEYRNYIAHLNRQAELDKEQVRIASTVHNREKQLFDEGLTAQSEYEEAKQTFLNKQQSREQLMTSLSSARIQEAQLQQSIIETQMEQSRESNNLNVALKTAYNELQVSINDWELAYLFVSPANGILSYNHIWQKNQNVSSGDKVFSIVAKAPGSIIGKIKLPAGGSGKVMPGQRVNISVTGYPYMEFGFLTGKVMSVSLLADDESAYTVTISLPQDLCTSYGKQLEFKGELTGMAEVMTDERSVTERLLSPLRYLWEKYL